MKSKIPAARWADIRLFAMDVDGILTDGTVQISSDGTEAKAFSILDGLGIVRLNRAAQRLGSTSSNKSPTATPGGAARIPSSP
jgi:3-deoxy-D-manno-octulosonate 8-phosphate phosphatase (KDO 8-P phosphatase)